MAQLVGRKCTICRERIPSELESRFCGICGNPVHNECSKSALLELRGKACTECGTKEEIAEKVKAEEHKKHRAAINAMPPPPPLELQTALATASAAYQTGRVALGGLVAISLGIILLVVPDFRSDLRTIGVGEVVAGTGAILVGVVLFVLAYFSSRQSG